MGQTASLLSGPIRCDEDSRIYLQPVGDNAILRVPSSGREAIRMPIALKGSEQVRDFSVSPAGDVSVLVTGAIKVTEGRPEIPPNFVVTLTSDEERGRIRLALSSYRADRLAVLKGGEFLVLGSVFNVPAYRPQRMLTLFDSRGGLLRQIQKFDDAKDQAALEPVGELVSMITGSDENAYLKLPSHGEKKEATILVVTPSGTIRNTLHISEPADYDFYDMKESGGHLALVFARMEMKEGRTSEVSTIVKVVYSNDGSEIATYVSPDIGLAFGCYSHGKFTFIRSAMDGTMELWSFSGR
jgi:hypothetical protein